MFVAGLAITWPHSTSAPFTKPLKAQKSKKQPNAPPPTTPNNPTSTKSTDDANHCMLLKMELLLPAKVTRSCFWICGMKTVEL